MINKYANTQKKRMIKMKNEKLIKKKTEKGWRKNRKERKGKTIRREVEEIGKGEE